MPSSLRRGVLRTGIAPRVPTESDTAGTVALQVTLPADHPITVAWDQPPAADGSEPERPAPARRTSGAAR